MAKQSKSSPVHVTLTSNGSPIGPEIEAICGTKTILPFIQQELKKKLARARKRKRTPGALATVSQLQRELKEMKVLRARVQRAEPQSTAVIVSVCDIKSKKQPVMLGMWCR